MAMSAGSSSVLASRLLRQKRSPSLFPRAGFWIRAAEKKSKAYDFLIYQAVLFTRFRALTLPIPVAKSHPGVAPNEG
jgi:hypothetical protein